MIVTDKDVCEECVAELEFLFCACYHAEHVGSDYRDFWNTFVVDRHFTERRWVHFVVH